MLGRALPCRPLPRRPRTPDPEPRAPLTPYPSGGILVGMLPLAVLWGLGFGAAWYEETIIALGVVAGLVAELMAWRAVRRETEQEVRDLRADLASLRADLVGSVARLSAEADALRAHVDHALSLDRRLAALEVSAATSDED